jgi:hypothetical protein
LSEKIPAKIVLFFTPAVVPWTEALRVQTPAGASVAAEKLKAVKPLAVPEPPVKAETPVISNPAGNTSVNCKPVKAIVGFGFVIVKLRSVVPLRGIVDGENALLMEGGAITVKVAL